MQHHNLNTDYVSIPPTQGFNNAGLKSEFTIEANNNCLNYDEKASPESFPFDIYEVYRLRLTSLINGAIFAIKNNVNLTENDKSKLIEQITELYKKKIEEFNKFKTVTEGKPISHACFGNELYRLIQQDLPKVSRLKSKELLLAEGFYVWQTYQRPTRMTKFTLKGGEQKNQVVIQQQTTPRAMQLTNTQKMQLITIHELYGMKPPQWYKDLPLWAQAYLRNIIPEPADANDISGNWKDYEKALPSILRYIPGEANAAEHQLTIQSSNGQTLSDTQLLVQGAPSSFYMKNDDERQSSTNENLAQMMSKSTLKEAEQRFKKAWGLSDNDNLPTAIPILFEGLVTPASQGNILSKFIDYTGISGAENNTRMVQEKQQAVAKFLLDQKEKNEFTIFNLNVALNQTLSVPVNPDQAFITFTENFHNILTPLIAVQRSKANLTNEELLRIQQREYDLKLLKVVTQHLKELSTQAIPGRNRNLYLAALYDVAMRLMYGFSSSNCKSTKDRNGIKILMADSMLVYAAELAANNNEPTIPKFNDTSKQHDHLVDIFAQLYASGHHLLVAHDNAPGSPGIKNEGQLLDDDIVQKLKSMKNDQGDLYHLSKEAADFNKPGTFWKKYGRKIQLWGTIAVTVLTAAISILLMASGVFSPLGILGIAAAAKLATFAVFIGSAINLSVTVAASAALVTAGCQIRNTIEKSRDQKNNFAAQMAMHSAPVESANSTMHIVESTASAAQQQHKQQTTKSTRSVRFMDDKPKPSDTAERPDKPEEKVTAKPPEPPK